MCILLTACLDLHFLYYHVIFFSCLSKKENPALIFRSNGVLQMATKILSTQCVARNGKDSCYYLWFIRHLLSRPVSSYIIGSHRLPRTMCCREGTYYWRSIQICVSWIIAASFLSCFSNKTPPFIFRSNEVLQPPIKILPHFKTNS